MYILDENTGSHSQKSLNLEVFHDYFNDQRKIVHNTDNNTKILLQNNILQVYLYKSINLYKKILI